MYEETITKILGSHTEREGEVASLVLRYVEEHPNWAREMVVYDDPYVAQIDKALMEVFKAPLSDYVGKSQRADMVEVRQMVALLLREITPYTLHRIAKIIGRDHSTVVWAIKTAKNRIRFEKGFREKYSKIKNLC